MANQSINLLFNGTSSVSFSAPIQQVSITDATNPQFLRKMVVSQDGVKIMRGASQCKIPKAQLYAAAVASDPTLTWPPVFTTWPTSSTVTHPASAFFTVVTNSELPVYYNWQYLSASAIVWTDTSTTASYFTGSNSSSLTCSNYPGTSLNGYQFQCVATSSAGATTSSAANLIVL